MAKAIIARPSWSISMFAGRKSGSMMITTNNSTRTGTARQNSIHTVQA